tara:strand:- start:18853 stop:19752 length:900 start_codon:yes stop_codon:yes gene_type:complete
MGWFSDTFLGTEDSGQKRTDYLADRKHGEFEQYASDFGASADKWSDRSDQFFDPNSTINQQRFGILNEAIQDQTASGIRDWQSAMAQQGLGQGAGGVGAQNILQARRRAGGDSASAMNKAYLDSFGLGMQSAQFASGQRSKGQGATGQADQIYAGANQAKMQQDSINAQKKAGFNQMLAGAAIGGIMPGVKGMLGGAMQGIGGDSPQWMQNFAKPYQDSMNMQQMTQDHMQGLMKYTQDSWGYNDQQASGVASYGNRGAGGGGGYTPPPPRVGPPPVQFASGFGQGNAYSGFKLKMPWE